MTMAAKFEDHLELGTTEITSDKTKNTYTIQKHVRFPSLYVIKSSKGERPKALDKMFTSPEEAKNFMRKYLEDLKMTVVARGDLRDARKAKEKDSVANAHNPESTDKV